jgi:hypothetical protein
VTLIGADQASEVQANTHDVICHRAPCHPSETSREPPGVWARSPLSCTGERSHALSFAALVSCCGWNERGASAWGLARCHDTDDTNRGSGDTRTIHWTVKMACSETFQMSLIGGPSDVYRNGGTRLCRPSLLRRERETDLKPFTRSTLAHPSIIAAPAS